MNETTGEKAATSAETGSAAQGCMCGGKGPAICAILRTMMPSDAAGEHFRNAKLELLKGFRELLDQRIQAMSGAQTRGTKLNVE